MGFLTYDGDTTGKVALLDKVKVMLAEIYTTYVAEIEAARGVEESLTAKIQDIEGDVDDIEAEILAARGGLVNLDTRLDGFETDIASLTNAELPGQTGNAGKYLTTDGAASSWTDTFSNAQELAKVHAIALYF